MSDVPDVPEESPESEAIDTGGETPWLRLNPLMLLVNPVQELIRFFPVVAVSLFWGTRNAGPDDGIPWQLIGVVLPILLGLWRYATTRYRITPTQIQLRHGLIGRNILVAPLDRVRTVELKASVIHRMLGLSKVKIGTGQSTGPLSVGGLELDSLPAAEARELRVALLHRSQQEEAATPAPDGTPSPAVAEPDEVLLRFDPRWARYAPLTASGLVVLGAIFALAGQFLGPGLEDLDESDFQSLHVALWVLAVLGFVGLAIAFVVLSVIGYLVANWRFTLSRDHAQRSYHVRRGLLTTTEMSLETKRIRGLILQRSILVRKAKAAALQAVVSGVGGDPGEATRQAPLTPLAPVAVSMGVGTSMLAGENDALVAPLIPHGPRAARRRWSRVALTFLPVAVAMAAAIWWIPLWTPLLAVPVLLLALGAYVARDRYRQLGHLLTERFLVLSSGSINNRRVVLERDAVIGWNIKQSFFQRRQGVATLTATIAAGEGGFAALDVTEQRATELADATTPGLLTPFLQVAPERE